MTLDDIRNYARAIFNEGVRAADPSAAVNRELQKNPLPNLDTGRHIILAIGKAASSMMTAALDHVPSGNNVEAIAVTNYENAVEIIGCTVFAAGHPMPDENGLKASKAIIDVLGTTRESDHVLCLISGGGSALLPAPVDGLSLEDKIAVNQILLASGFDIVETNLVRQQISKLKGGRLGTLAAPAKLRSILISDVIGDNPSAIASGPTAPQLGTRDEAVRLLREQGVWGKLPTSVKEHLSKPEVSAKITAHTTNKIVCSNRQSLEAIANAARDWSPTILSSSLSGDVSNVAQMLIDQIKGLPETGNQLLIWGGETTVHLQGTGKGGRNQELALRFAQLSDGLTGDWVFLSGGTDGRDGPTDAAGGLVDMTTKSRAKAAGINIPAMLANNDSYHALQSVGDLLLTGATGTNVADIQMFIRPAVR